MGEEKEETLKFTCIVCPIGCELIVKKVGAKIIDIKGYTNVLKVKSTLYKKPQTRREYL